MRPVFSLLVIAAAAVAGTDARAIGLGPVRSAAVLGQPLDLPVPMRLDDGETVGSECITAEVIAGEQKLPPGDVRVVVDSGTSAGQRVLRVQTSSAILEPVVSVAVAAGCPLQLMRRFVVFADPPPLVVATPVAPSVVAPSLPAAAASPVATTPAAPPAPSAAATPQAAEGRSGSERSAAPSQRAESVAPPAPRQRPPRTTSPSRSADAPPRTARAVPPAPRASAVAARPRPATTAARAPATPRAADASAAQPRLKLEAAAPSLAVQPTPAVVAAAASAPAVTLPALPAASASAGASAGASASDEAAAAAARRMAAMEAELERLRAESRANRDALLQLRSRVDDDQGSDHMAPGLATVAALLAVLAGWLAWRLRQLSRARQPWWDSRAPVLGAAAEAAPVAEGMPEPAPVPDVVAVPAIVRNDAPETLPLALPPEPPMPEMSVDEQIDLEQQADFFIVLGQDESAIELLQSHLISGHGASPLPYLKLLDIYRRRGEREAYEELRDRFNDRFNGHVPAIDTDPHDGRALEDYPEVVGRLQHQWSRPADALATLEALLLKRGAGAGRFELPAYRDLMALHQLARELAQHDGETRRAAEVDLLLPIGEDDAPALQAVHPSAFAKTAVLEPGSVPPRPPV